MCMISAPRSRITIRNVRLTTPPGQTADTAYQNERENLGFESGDDSEYLILPLLSSPRSYYLQPWGYKAQTVENTGFSGFFVV